MAHLLAVEEGTARKYAEAPDASGRDLPQERAITLLGKAASLSSERAENLIDEYLAHFAVAARRKIVRFSALLEIEEALLHLKNGKAHRSLLERCPHCHGPVEVVAKSGGFFVYRCPSGCGRGGVGEVAR